MTGDPERRWADDSPEEDFEAHRAREIDRLQRWMAEQRTRPLTDALGAQPEGQGWAGPLILPDWWDEIPEPGDQCWWCQRPGVPAPCPECRAGREQDDDPSAAWAWWARCTPAQRRLHIAATYGTDPWSGRRCSIRMEWTDTDAEGQIATSYPLWFGAAPRGIFWRAARQA